jgi:RTX calcium-binding nonapeptide repeat (4 copies)
MAMPALGTKEYNDLLVETGGASANNWFNYDAHVSATTNSGGSIVPVPSTQTTSNSGSSTSTSASSASTSNSGATASNNTAPIVLTNPPATMPAAGTAEYNQLVKEIGFDPGPNWTGYERHIAATRGAWETSTSNSGVTASNSTAPIFLINPPATMPAAGTVEYNQLVKEIGFDPGPNWTGYERHIAATRGAGEISSNSLSLNNGYSVASVINNLISGSTPSSALLIDVADKTLTINASSWTALIKINLATKASNNGDVLEAKQVDFTSSETFGSVIQGGNGNDIISGKGGWDVIDGGAGSDLIHSGNGRDIITGGVGADELHGDFGWNTYKSEKDGSSDLIAIKSDQYLVNWLYGKAGNNLTGEKSDVIEGLDPIDKIRIIGVDTSEITFMANVSAKGITGIGIYGKGALEALYIGGDLTLAQITQMTSGDASAAAMSNSVNAYGVW